MNTKIQKWGNSQGLRIRKDILEEMKLKIGDEVNISIQENKIVIQEIKNTKYKIENLVKEIPLNYNKKEEINDKSGIEEW